MNRTLIKLITILSLICLALPLNCFAQAQQSSNQAARKFDEFGDILITDKKARLDGFAVELENTPNTRGFIIVYRTRRDLPGLSGRLANSMQKFLVGARGLPSARVIAVDGGVASCLTQELWIVPVGATPTPRSDAYSNQFVDTESAWKFDEYYYYLPKDRAEAEDVSDVFVGNSLEAFAEALRKQPRSQAYIIAYPEYYIERWEVSEYGDKFKTRQRIFLDSSGTAQKMQKAVNADLINKYRVASSRIKIVNGGYRKMRSVELWIVPRGVHAPIATPDAFPKKHRRLGRNV
jgi:hypothetical protein